MTGGGGGLLALYGHEKILKKSLKIQVSNPAPIWPFCSVRFILSHSNAYNLEKAKILLFGITRYSQNDP